MRHSKNYSNTNETLTKEREQLTCHSNCFYLAMFSYCPNEHVSFSYKFNVNIILM